MSAPLLPCLRSTSAEPGLRAPETPESQLSAIAEAAFSSPARRSVVAFMNSMCESSLGLGSGTRTLDRSFGSNLRRPSGYTRARSLNASLTRDVSMTKPSAAFSAAVIFFLKRHTYRVLVAVSPGIPDRIRCGNRFDIPDTNPSLLPGKGVKYHGSRERTLNPSVLQAPSIPQRKYSLTAGCASEALDGLNNQIRAPDLCSDSHALLSITAVVR